MTVRFLCLSFLGAMAISACSPNTSPTDIEPIKIEDQAILSDPLATLIPWDANRNEVQTTESGLQYVILNAGETSGERPTANDRATVNYEGRLAADGTKFDSSYDRGSPATFGVTQVIPGWTEALQLMRPGDDWVVYLPSNIAYGERGTPGGPIGPNADLVFRMNLVETVKDTTPGAEIFDANLPWDANKEGLITTDSGLQYLVLESGDPNGDRPTIDSRSTQHFEIRKASDSRRIDGTFASGSPQTIPLANLIPGWSEALQLMRPGDDWLIYLPSAIAFGENGTPGGPIGPNEDIVMRLKLESIAVPQVSDTNAWEQHTPWKSDAAGVTKTESGLEYIVIEAGDPAGQKPTTANRVEVYYEGRLTTGETFDSAYQRGESIEFGVTQVIPGWTEALQLMVPGDRWLVYIPSQIAYGQNPRPGGIIKPGDDLIFEMQLISVR